MHTDHDPTVTETYLPLTATFQSSLVRQLCEHRGFAAVALPHLHAHFFQNPLERWAFGQIADYHQRYKMPPTLAVLTNHAHQITNPADRSNIVAHLIALGHQPPLLPDVAAWLTDKVLVFARQQFLRNMLARSVTLANEGRMDDALEYTVAETSKLNQITQRTNDRSDFFGEFEGRHRARSRPDSSERIPTGFPTLDNVLNGGLAKGELGLWMAYAGNGKTTMLSNLGASAARMGYKVLHLVYEGRRQQVEARYDAIFAGYDYRQLNRGNLPADVLDKLRAQYQALRGNLIIRGFTSADDDVWNCSVESIVNELIYHKETTGWVPDLLVVDYVDLLQSRNGGRTTTERQQGACQELHTLANQGYGIWTACQPQRPAEDADVKPHVLKGRQMADCYAKFRIADFVGSLNMTLEERANKVCRLYAEKYRDGEATVEWAARCDLSIMTIREESGIESPHAEARVGVQSTKRLGYMTDPRQTEGF